MKLFATKKCIFITWLAAISLLFVTAAANAVVVSSLYSAQIPTFGTTSSQQQLLAQGLAQVLVKVSGNSTIMSLPAIRTATRQPDSFVDSYSYNNSDASNTHYIQINFSSRAIRKLLSSNGQAIWGSDRPLVLVWIAAPAASGNTILSNDTDNQLTKALQQYSLQRGLPILLPMMDLQDVNSVNTNTLATPDLNQITAASKRYHADAILVGTITQNVGPQYQSNWDLLTSDANLKWTISADSAGKILAQTINTVADDMATRYAMLADNSLNKVLSLQVTGVKDLGECQQVMNELKKLSSVTKVELLNVAPNQIKLRVKTINGQQGLLDNLRANNKFSVVTSNSQNSQVDVSFHWNG